MSFQQNTSCAIRNVNENCSDQITLNVGGTCFTTCISTLTRSSFYFDAMFSQYWSSETTLDKEQKPIFIDKDPQPFSYLLTYMREGTIDMPESNPILAKQIILQAHYFGMDDYVRWCKAKAWTNTIITTSSISTTDTGEKDNDERERIQIASDAFDAMYPSLLDAFETKLLPNAIFGPLVPPLDHITIIVGGQETFELSKSTLKRHSNYFNTRLLCNTNIRLDEDPQAFAILVLYMRYTHVNLPKNDVFLFKRTLTIACRYEMNDFILLVKARTMMNIEKREAPMGIDSDSYVESFNSSAVDTNCMFAFTRCVTPVHRRYACGFDRRFQNFDKAFAMNILPDRFFA